MPCRNSRSPPADGNEAVRMNRGAGAPAQERSEPMSEQHRRQSARFAGSLMVLLLAAAPAAVGAQAAPNPKAAIVGSVLLTAPGVTGVVAPRTSVTLHAETAGLSGIRYLRFYDGAAQICVDQTEPWNCVVRRIVSGRHAFKAQAILRGGAVVDSPVLEVVAGSAPANQPPTVAILTPAN